ncbi:MAG: Peptidyl-tRNA hydrolase [Candidatus Daviesbacteria bacterium GW2011_GWA2_38_24]|uniref:Peptidyl-tRNA hydrolase n=1 Tax=Candidatus Daviesbacteria bacterium GW2011_GWA2_38_24 TaxID=1618422 RepID=A0A0G0ML46_9BACT|nr:MAG: Peptidyl-tRNA hydrolase [Candidatus Daviesbacteria bacterium GW2011_GWA2_38_24]KKQ80697.1 MAG: Peptidyl-tRNA hydrolase [Candidatus Daviesbacteria bacterium GW2011_GWA1_38_7]OGE24324.1 MAG: aminoacyl-tRNA hydrolase [Candidatus Daviesbacteria bacterium RIFCSPHIGHO2_01_FULL_38_8]
MKLIVGLGNPEPQYEGTRHNLGFTVIDEFRRKHNLGDWELDNKFKSEIIEYQFKISNLKFKIILSRPQTYMNKSGLSIGEIVRYFKISPEEMIVIHDDLDLPLGQIKIRQGGSAAGHHGVESIIDALDSDQFIRIRLGIGNLKTKSAEHGGSSIVVEHYVLEPFESNEKSQVKHMLKRALKATEALLENGLEKAQNQFNQ